MRRALFTLQLVGLVTGLLLGVVAEAVEAQENPCDDPSTSRVAVRFVGDAWTERFRDSVLAELHAALVAQDMAACAAEAMPGTPVAEIQLRTLGLPRVAVVIEVRDDVTDKRVARDIDMASFPEDTRALALAVATDELLRASWMELALADAPEPPRPPPAAVRRAVRVEIERSRPSVTTLTLRGAGWLYTGGETHLGGDLLVGHRLGSLFSFELSVGARRGLRQAGTNGSVHATALGGGLELRMHPWLEKMNVGPSAGLLAQRVVFVGDAGPGGVDAREQGMLVQVLLGAFIEQRIGGPLVLHGSAGIGVPLLGVAATDAGERVTAASGASLYVRLGAGVLL